MSVNEDFNNFYIQYNLPDCLSEPKKAHECVEDVSIIGDKTEVETGHAEKKDQPDLWWPHKLERSKYRCHESELQNYGRQSMFCDSVGFSTVDSAGLFGRTFISEIIWPIHLPSPTESVSQMTSCNNCRPTVLNL
uniref:Uncharacterized protein n=1 Tax=Cryptomonas curvata TaxID=233186 RepID=A0A7S0QID8_9CRYP|mmetsp:Transcript_26768/g.55567  ORF Transcript_26768/g.55567 Transcript_26768/m.55567 type:complete len:135 (+) Transcript_26768:131-535(+)